ncbi:50S ribosomal protein L22 [Clostridia bacterium]
MESKAKASYVRMSPRKVQIVLDLIRNQPADKAMAILKFTPKAATEPVMKVLKSAMANAENNFNMDTTRLYVAYAHVAPGPILKRIQPRAQGRAYRINKRTSHITLVLKEMED